MTWTPPSTKRRPPATGWWAESASTRAPGGWPTSEAPRGSSLRLPSPSADRPSSPANKASRPKRFREMRSHAAVRGAITRPRSAGRSRPDRARRTSRTTGLWPPRPNETAIRARGGANSKLSPNRMRKQILVEAREHYVQMGRNLVCIGEESVMAESVATSGAIPDGATAGTGAM